MLGIRSARRWYWLSTSAQAALTCSSRRLEIVVAAARQRRAGGQREQRDGRAGASARRQESKHRCPPRMKPRRIRTTCAHAHSQRLRRARYAACDEPLRSRTASLVAARAGASRARRSSSTRRIPASPSRPTSAPALSEFDLREGEDCFVDELYLPATERGVGLIAALAPRTYIDLNRHAGDIDLALLEGGAGPASYVPSGKARLGKALIWRTLDDGRDDLRRASSRVDEVQRRIERYHRPYHRALRERIEATHARFGAQLAHRLPFDERRRRRARRRRRRRGARRLRRSAIATARPATPASPSSCAASSPAWATTCASTIRTRASSWCAPTRIRPQRPHEPAARDQQAALHGRGDARRRAPASTPLQRELDDARRRRARLHRERAAPTARADGTAALPSAAAQPQRVQLKRSAGWKMPAEHRQGRSHDALGQSVHGRRVRQRRRRRRPARRAGCAARSPRRAASSRPRARRSARALGGRNLACWCALNGPCHADLLLALANAGARRRHARLAARGSDSVATAPPPGWFLSVARPRCRSAISLTNDRPRPVLFFAVAGRASE